MVVIGASQQPEKPAEIMPELVAERIGPKFADKLKFLLSKKTGINLVLISFFINIPQLWVNIGIKGSPVIGYPGGGNVGMTGIFPVKLESVKVVQSRCFEF